MGLPITEQFVVNLVKQPIKSFEVGEGSKKGDNVAGDLKSIKVITEKGDTISLVNKTFPDDPMNKAFSVEGGSFRIENTFYSKIIPMLDNLLKSRNVDGPAIPAPKYYGGLNDDENDYICMEDLRPSGFRMPDKYTGLNFAETSLILAKLARFHASTYFLLRHEGEKVLDQFPLIQKPRFFEPEMQDELGLMMNGVMANSIEVIKERDEELAKRMKSAFAAQPAAELASRTMFSTDKKFFPCVVHGDIWCNNTLIKYANDKDNTTPVDVKFIDFQQVRRGNIFEDLQYFIFTSTTPEFRKKHLYESLDVYYDAFTKMLGEIKCPVPINFTRGFLIDSFESCMLPIYAFMGFALPLQLGIMPPMEFPTGPPPQIPGGGEDGEAPPPFNPRDIPLAIRVQGFLKHVEGMLKNCPKAIERLEDITREMAVRGYL